MASRNSESVIEQIVGGRGFVLMDKDLIGKLEIVTTFSNFIKKIENLILKGDPESAINLLRVLLDPQAVVVRGTIQKVGRLMTTATLERRMKQTLEKELMKDKGGIQKAYDTLIAIYGHLSPTDVFELSANGISFWIYEETQRGRDTNYVTTAIKHIQDFVVEWKGSRGEGQWNFPECWIGVYINVLGESKKLAVEPVVRILYPRPYKHMFVYTGQQNICLGTFTSSARQLVKASSSSSLSQLLLPLFANAEMILREGYNRENVSPAHKHIYDPIYEEFRISRKVSPEYLQMKKDIQATKRKIKRRTAQNGNGGGNNSR